MSHDAVLLKQEDIKGQTDFFSHGMCYKKPDKKDCYKGSHVGGWLISLSKHINFVEGEDKDGKVRKHHGNVFAKNDIYQVIPDEVYIQKKVLNFEEHQMPKRPWAM